MLAYSTWSSAEHIFRSSWEKDCIYHIQLLSVCFCTDCCQNKIIIFTLFWAQVLRKFDTMISGNCTTELESNGVELLRRSKVRTMICAAVCHLWFWCKFCWNHDFLFCCLISVFLILFLSGGQCEPKLSWAVGGYYCKRKWSWPYSIRCWLPCLGHWKKTQLSGPEPEQTGECC